MKPAAWGAFLVLAAASRGAAQEPHGVEAGVIGITTLADRGFAGGGLSVGVRPGGGARVMVAMTAGSTQHRFAARGELVGHLLLSPGRRQGADCYGIAGVAGVFGPRDAGVLILGLGVERSPAGRSGWYLEAGVGGGMRIAAGWRWRWLSTPRAAPP